VRLPLRFVRGLREECARRIEAARAERAFTHVADLAQRAALAREELLALAELGALAAIDPAARTRRAALWQVAALERDPRSLFAGQPPAAGSAAPSAQMAAAQAEAAASPLPEMSPLETTLADYRASGISAGPHVMAHVRPGLRARGVLSAAELRDIPDGRRVRTAGHVIVRQRPGTARGVCFLTLEDETGTSNAVLTPSRYRRFRVALHSAPLAELEGRLENREGVVHLLVDQLTPLAVDLDDLDALAGAPAGPATGGATEGAARSAAGARRALPRSHDYR
jgi:error-prone DNA polymerase